MQNWNAINLPKCQPALWSFEIAGSLRNKSRSTIKLFCLGPLELWENIPRRLEGEMTGERSGDSRWLSVSGLQNEHSLMLQKLRLSPRPLPGRPLKSRSGESERRMLRAAGGLSWAPSPARLSDCSDSVTSTCNVVWKDVAMAALCVCAFFFLSFSFLPSTAALNSSAMNGSRGTTHCGWMDLVQRRPVHHWTGRRDRCGRLYAAVAQQLRPPRPHCWHAPQRSVRLCAFSLSRVISSFFFSLTVSIPDETSSNSALYSSFSRPLFPPLIPIKIPRILHHLSRA